MSKATKPRKLTTNEALEHLLGRKAAKRLRKLAMEVARRRSKKDDGRKEPKAPKKPKESREPGEPRETDAIRKASKKSGRA
jgi:hypothetical protein